ncbi:MAG TPA: MFS transporter [Candidatus Dormibacteraeota bacterium]
MRGQYRWLVLAVGVLAQAALSAFHQGLPAIGPELQRHFHVGLVQTGALLSAVAAGITLTLALWGSLADRFGERAVLAAGLAGAALALSAAALLQGSYAGMFGALVVAGMLGSCANAASGRAVMVWFGAHQRGTALGIRQMATPLGGAAAALALPFLALRFGVAGALWGLAAACLAAAVACGAALRRRSPPRAGGGNTPLRDLRLWRLALGGSLIVAGQLSLITYLVLFLNQHRGLLLAAAALVLTLCQLGGAAARVLAGAWSDRLGERIRPMRWLAAGGGLLLLLTALVAEGPLVLLVPVLLVTTVVCMSTNGLAFTATGELAGTERAGVAMGFQNTWLFISGALAPIAFGAVVAAFGWRAGFGLMCVLAFAGWALLAPLRGHERAGWAKAVTAPNIPSG